MTKEDFLSLLRTLQSAVEEDDSYEGHLEYSLGDKYPDMLVQACIRVGNQMGQGGVLLVGDTSADSAPPLPLELPEVPGAGAPADPGTYLFFGAWRPDRAPRLEVVTVSENGMCFGTDIYQKARIPWGVWLRIPEEWLTQMTVKTRQLMLEPWVTHTRMLHPHGPLRLFGSDLEMAKLAVDAGIMVSFGNVSEDTYYWSSHGKDTP